MKNSDPTFRRLKYMPGILLAFHFAMLSCQPAPGDTLKERFKNPPDFSKPGVYWYFMDGNLSREGMTKDLESMHAAGIGSAIFLEVGIGVPRGPVDFMSEEWQDLFVHAVREAERLGIRILMGAGPGWCGSGGPWVKPEESMKHLVFSEKRISGGKKVNVPLPIPKQRSTVWHTMKDPYYEDLAVYAIPSSVKAIIEDINEKALYERDPYSSKPGVKPYLPSLAEYEKTEPNNTLNQENIMDVTPYLQDNGHLVWDAPEGTWTIIRMGARVTGASTRPSPKPVIGLECNKLDAGDFESHLKNYTDILLEKTAPRLEGAGWTGFHMDSWESGAQNWTEGLLEEFKNRRAYDPEPYLLAYTGRAIQSVEMTERFLWDLRLTLKELLIENHAEFGKAYAHAHGLELTIEPYDMNPAGDLDLGAVADVIMAEFWSKRFGYQTAYAVLEATSIARISGKVIVGAEVFTSNNEEAWQEYPWSMKDQSDWALALGVNRFMYHTFAHKPLGEKHRPGMTMGPYGVHWDRGQTWWPMVEAYHQYISRSSYMMQQGQAVSDILYLTPEGAPMVFTPPADALEENGSIPDKKGYGFDACSPAMLLEKADVRKGKIVFPGAASYEIMVLPNCKTMTPALLEKITSLVEKGARVLGTPPLKSPGLTDYPDCDIQVKELATKLWGSLQAPGKIKEVNFGEGTLYWGGDFSFLAAEEPYPPYQNTIKLLSELNIQKDFRSDKGAIRFGHRKTEDREIYFVANRTERFQSTLCSFRAGGEPELWMPTTGETRKITAYTYENGITRIPMEFFPYESFFITFSDPGKGERFLRKGEGNFPALSEIQILHGAWDLAFDPTFGGPEHIPFGQLMDWTAHEKRGIRYYSGIATYTKTFEVNDLEDKRYFLDLGVVHDIASVKLNGKELGVVWCAPWQIDISQALKEGVNQVEIEVANRWINRLLGDRQSPDANVRTVKFDNGLMGGKEYTTGRYTFTTESAMRSFRFKEPLPSGLLGPVSIKGIRIH
jgi:hypothetical protein